VDGTASNRDVLQIAVGDADEAAPGEPQAGPKADGDTKPDTPALISFPHVSYALTGLFVLGIFYTAYFARAVLIPITMAIILNFVLAPLTREITRRVRWPHPISAVLVVILFFGAIAFAFTLLSSPAADWMVKLPNEMSAIERKLRPLSGAVQNVQDAAQTVENMAQGQGPENPGERKPMQVVVRGPSLTQLFLGQTMNISMGVLVTFGLLLFLLASGDALLRQAVTIAPRLTDKKKVVEIARETEGEISHYLASITCINIGMGVLIGGAMWWLGLPNPALWGVMAALLNFVPVAGPFASAAVISLVSIMTFDGLTDTILPPLVYLGIHLLESQVLTPFFVSRRLMLNPVAVLLSLIFWTWMWGIPGALLAVPILAAFKIACERVEGFQALAIMLTSPNRIADPTKD
jgi:predicted PurR-regulated permease PerM